MSRFDYDEPVFREDVEAEHEYAQEGWKTFFRMYYQLAHQGAPPELVDRVTKINNLYKELTAEVTAIMPCFPPRPK